MFVSHLDVTHYLHTQIREFRCFTTRIPTRIEARRVLRLKFKRFLFRQVIPKVVKPPNISVRSRYPERTGGRGKVWDRLKGSKIGA